VAVPAEAEEEAREVARLEAQEILQTLRHHKVIMVEVPQTQGPPLVAVVQVQ